ncbi:hypothetical protein [Mesonia mobilis]|uniref:Uncharacterized protein n=1 Tax=Mesonia mobilis TaxID=369791 RepID=A0ABQ3BKZ0_9FLAO|nr:hypothetical protein [Mesonia mobilis]MBQ0737496.1 hypothetical protein [Aquimarina celericrescens]GGZ45903.1 hypothetical protein GCM10008088_04040 [Mesonia mobilis]
MEIKQELKLLQEIEDISKAYIFFTHNESAKGYFYRGIGDEVVKGKIDYDTVKGKRFYKTEDLENLLPNLIHVNFIDFSEDNEVSAPIPNIETLQKLEKPINIINLGNGINLST